MGSDIHDMIGVVSSRAAILSCIYEHSRDKRELTEALPQSRSTIDRAVRTLEEYDLVYREGGSCHLTYVGKAAYECYDGLERSFDTLDDARSMLAPVSLDTDICHSVFEDGVVLHPPEQTPYREIREVCEEIRASSRIRLLSSVALPPYIDQILSAAVNDSTDVVVVTTPGVVEALRETRRELMGPSIATGDTIYQTDGLPAYAPLLIDEDVLYTAFFADSNHLTGVIKNTADRPIRWAASQISAHRADATLVPE